MKYIYIFAILLFICILIFCNQNIYESFDNDIDKKCDNKFFEENSFCQLDVNKNKCVCKFQKDEMKYAFNSPEVCCEKRCNQIPPEDCLENNEFTEMPYYCNIGGQCKKYMGTIVSSHISANNCGTDPLNNQLLLPYESEEDCLRSINPCDKYNNKNNSVHKNKEECLTNTNCGFCTNEYGQGKCIEGNASKPIDLRTYYYCVPGVDKKNTYTYGNRALYLY